MRRIDPFGRLAIGCIVIAGLVEAAQQALSNAPKVQAILPGFFMSPNINYLPLLLLTMAGISWMIKHWRKPIDIPATTPIKIVTHTEPQRPDRALPQIEILSDLSAGVSYERSVRGLIRAVNSPICVLVFSGDGQWYRQQNPTFDGTTWSVLCRFGNPDGPFGKYKIVAIEAASIPDKIPTLPEGLIRSPIIEVNRVEGAQSEFDLESFRTLVPIVKNSYIQRKQPPRGQPLPSDWLPSEILHLGHELRRHELDLTSLDGAPVEEPVVVTSQLDLIRYKTRLSSEWSKGVQEFKNVETVFTALLTTWGNVERVKNMDQKIIGGQIMTPQVLDGAQEQMKKAALRFRISLIPVSQLLANLAFKE